MPSLFVAEMTWSKPFNFSITRTTLAQLSTAPTYGFAHQYALPTNPFCLRVLEMEEKDYKFKIIRHKNKKYAFFKKLFSSFKKN